MRFRCAQPPKPHENLNAQKRHMCDPRTPRRRARYVCALARGMYRSVRGAGGAEGGAFRAGRRENARARSARRAVSALRTDEVGTGRGTQHAPALGMCGAAWAGRRDAKRGREDTIASGFPTPRPFSHARTIWGPDAPSTARAAGTRTRVRAAAPSSATCRYAHGKTDIFRPGRAETRRASYRMRGAGRGPGMGLRGEDGRRSSSSCPSPHDARRSPAHSAHGVSVRGRRDVGRAQPRRGGCSGAGMRTCMRASDRETRAGRTYAPCVVGLAAT